LVKIFSESQVSSLPIIRHVRKDGSTFLVNMEARLSGFKDKPALIIAVWDVTEKLEQQAQLLQAGKMATLGEMATGLAHELNQPLNVIRIASDFLQKKLKRGLRLSDEELFKTADELEANVERATRIITHLREFGYKAQERMERISISAPISGVYTMLGRQLTKRGISWKLNVDDNLPEIMGDENRLEQVFINLILNARDAMLEHEKKSSREGKTVDKILSIKAFQEKNNVVVTISDTGPGISVDLRQKIFEPFFTSKKVGEGTGIGLSISYNIIKEHKGSIEVMENGEQGATFRLTFPALNEVSGNLEGGLS
jgi:C4-dicarboxylate-specific signal transduction histidine kinase